MGITVFRHSDSSSLGNLAPAIQARGIECDMVTAYRADLEKFDALKDDLVIFLGGNCGVYQADMFPFINQELRIIEDRLKNDLPVLGICLGGQLIAKALGADVRQGQQGMEVLWSPINLTAEGEDSVLSHLGSDKTNMTHFHRDTFDIPQGATLLGSSKLYRNQAFSYGSNILGLQFHPEVNYDIVTNWEVNGMSSMAARGDLDLVEVRKDTAQYMDALIDQADKFMHAWLDQIGLEYSENIAKRT